MQENPILSLGWEDPLAKEMAPHSNIFAWEMPWTEVPGGLQSMGPQRVGRDLATKPQQMPDIIVSIIYTVYNTLTYLHTTINRY